MKIVVVADEDTVTGLKLAGIDEGYGVQSPEDANPILLTLSERKDVGLIIITERIADSAIIRSTITKITEQEFPIIVEIQDKHGIIIREVDPIKALIKRAVGVDL
ncbi:MAG: V-type ATP synthase subunit F [Promethearchaeota archaeon]